MQMKAKSFSNALSNKKKWNYAHFAVVSPSTSVGPVNPSVIAENLVNGKIMNGINLKSVKQNPKSAK